jgi:hypothetical protein
MSDYGVSGGVDEELVEEWSEEVLTIQNLLDDALPGESPSTAEERVDRTMALRARALAVWDAVGVPIRWREGLVHHIRAPRDLLGTPIIRVLPPQEYAEALATRLWDEVARSAALNKRLRTWRVVAAVLALAFFLAATS